PENPRVVRGATANHHGIAAGLAVHRKSIFRRENISVSNHRDSYRGLHLGNPQPIGSAAVALFTRTRVESNRCQAAIFGDTSHFHCHEFFVVPASTEL